ncbi:protein lplB [Spirochaetia bacterium]|nr:protein lplB [Spirochaetia bacterium]
MKLKSLGLYVKRRWFLYALLAFPFAHYIIFQYIPMYGVNIAFKEYNIFAGVSKSPWIGFANFREIFMMKNFTLALRNTLTLNLLDLFFGFPAPIILAILLNELRAVQFKKIAQTLLYLPHFLSWVIIGGMVLQIFAPTTGVINALIVSWGGKSLPFLTDKWYWLFTYTGIGIWQGAGWGTIIYLAAITGINEELYEAAEVDGAGRLRKIWHITLPGIRPTIVILLILNVGRMITIGFDRPYVIGNVLVRDFSEVLSTFVYRIGIQSMRFSIATAAGVFQSVVGLILLLITNAAAKRLGEQGVW